MNNVMTLDDLRESETRIVSDIDKLEKEILNATKPPTREQLERLGYLHSDFTINYIELQKLRFPKDNLAKARLVNLKRFLKK